MDYQETYLINKIYVIDCNTNEKYGRALYDDIISNRCDQRRVAHKYIIGDTKQKFKNALSSILEECKVYAIMPFVHIESHGNKNGLTLDSGAKFNWNELEFYLESINIVSKNNLIVSLAACHGIKLQFKLLEIVDSSIKRAPFSALISPSKRIEFGSMEEGYEAFFKDFLSDFDMIRSLKLLNSKIHEDVEVKLVSAAMNLRFFFQLFIKNELPKIAENEVRLTTHAANMLSQNARSAGKMPNNEDLIKMKTLFKSKSFYDMVFENFKNTYLMLDLYPDQKFRFDRLNLLKDVTYLN